MLSEILEDDDIEEMPVFPEISEQSTFSLDAKITNLTKIITSMAMKQDNMERSLITILNLILSPTIGSVFASTENIPVNSLEELQSFNEKLGDVEF